MRKILVGMLVGLAACAVAPITIDLLPRIGNEKSGELQLPVVPGTFPFTLKLPLEPYQVDFSDESFPSVTGVGLDYRVKLSYTGILGQKPLGGTLTVQPYLAPQNDDPFFQDKHKLGSPQTVQLAVGQNEFFLAGIAPLNATQLAGFNQKRLRIGYELTGNVSSNGFDLLTFRYEVERLILSLTLL